MASPLDLMAGALPADHQASFICLSLSLCHRGYRLVIRGLKVNLVKGFKNEGKGKLIIFVDKNQFRLMSSNLKH
ncbi:hypothetical protein PGTUg99_031195 [Puccinia graminis f. sp. tritici]|uniref:Uncharacterized protein n=1 Tax=Puccinia graminis f. sp. tritici TaxID=56615 RepID=A0A5B0RPF9_PUCGR|nr:hypothetical protein PGTUg99_031195 [Puccinia graminis f. sp. tritici]